MRLICLNFCRISNGLSNLSASTNLSTLNLSGNKIKDLEELKPLENFKELESLDLFNNEATSIDSYRQKIFSMLPSLVYLDGFDVNDVEAESEGDDDDEVNGNDSEEDGEEGKCCRAIICSTSLVWVSMRRRGRERTCQSACLCGFKVDCREVGHTRKLHQKRKINKSEKSTQTSPLISGKFSMVPINQAIKYQSNAKCNANTCENEWKWTVSTDFTKPFAINGLEFDLAELERYENRLKSTSAAAHSRLADDSADDLDEYLERMALNAAPHVVDVESNATDAKPSTSAVCNANDPTERHTNAHSANRSAGNMELAGDARSGRTSWPLLLFGLLSILAFVNSVQCKRIQQNYIVLIRVGWCYSAHSMQYTNHNTFFFRFYIGSRNVCVCRSLSLTPTVSFRCVNLGWTLIQNSFRSRQG